MQFANSGVESLLMALAIAGGGKLRRSSNAVWKAITLDSS